MSVLPMGQTSILLSNGNSMPLIGLGTWQTEGDDDTVETAVRAAVDAGYRCIDTAFVYQNEDTLGRALKKIFSEGIVIRDDMFITTKLPINGFRSVEYFCKKSLDALQLDYVDLYLIHAPVSSKRTEKDEEFLPIEDGKFAADYVSIEETWKDMEALVDKGLVRSIGVSNFNSKQIQRILNTCKIRPANLQVECHVYFPQYELHDFCKKENISFTAYSPLGSPGFAPFLKKRMGLDVQLPNVFEEPTLNALDAKYQKQRAQILLRYLVQRGIQVIPKSSNPDRIKENFQIFDFNLSDEDMNALKSLQTGTRFFKFDFPKGLTDHPEYPFSEPF